LRRFGLRSTVVAAAIVLAGSGAAVLTTASASDACVVDTDGDCYNSSYGYWTIQNTDSAGLYEHTRPDINSPTVGSLRNGTAVEVICQTNGTTDPYDNLPYTVWDKLDNGSYIYDGYFVSSPGDGYHIVLQHC